MKIKHLQKIMCILLMTALFGCATNSPSQAITDHEQLKDKKIGVMTGTIYDAIIKERFPEAERQYYNTFTDLSSALLSHKVDALAEDENLINGVQRNNPGIVIIGEPITEVYIGFAFAKNDKGKTLHEQMNSFLSEMRNNGVLKELEEKWRNYDDNTEMFDYETLNGTNGTLKLATDSSAPPYSMVINGKTVGYEIELAALFCEKFDYKLEVVSTNFSGIVSGVQSGKTDFGVGGLGITEERSKSVDFSDPTATVYGYIAVLDESVKEDRSFLKGILNSLEKTFVKEKRWVMFVEGIVTTMLITVLSLLLGTLFGFIVYLKGRTSKGLFVKIVKFFIWLIQGMPMVVLLMILYYIIFGSTAINGFYIAIFGFALAFACSMYGMLEAGEKAVDKGQGEAAFTLGYNPRQTFFKIILPQAANHFLPTYKAEIVSLIKSTAIVGYIAVEDITKVGDIIRSRTYEAFFPLIVIAVMYFVMAAVLTAAVNRIDIRIDPNRRDVKKITEGLDL